MAWMGTVPVMGGPVQRLLAASARPVASLAMAATGAQFFLDDAAASAQADPLLVRAAGAMRPGTGCLMCRPCPQGVRAGDARQGIVRACVVSPANSEIHV